MKNINFLVFFLQLLPNTQLFVVPVGDRVDLNEVDQIASQPTSTFVLGKRNSTDVRLMSVDDVIGAAGRLLDEICP